MRVRIKRTWNFIQVLRLVAGIGGIVQGFMMKEFALSIAGFFLFYMAIADVESSRVNGYEVELKEAKSTSKETEHEKVDARL